MSRANAICQIGMVALLAGCSASAKVPLGTTAASTCVVALKVENNTESALNVYWKALDRSGDGIPVGRARPGKSTIRLPKTVIAQLNNGPNHFYSRRLSDASYVDEQKLSYQPTCG